MSIFIKNSINKIGYNGLRKSKLPIEILWPHKDIKKVLEYNKKYSTQELDEDYHLLGMEWPSSRFDENFTILGLDWPSSRFK